MQQQHSTCAREVVQRVVVDHGERRGRAGVDLVHRRDLVVALLAVGPASASYIAATYSSSPCSESASLQLLPRLRLRNRRHHRVGPETDRFHSDDDGRCQRGGFDRRVRL